MRIWLAMAMVCAAGIACAQQDQAAKANDLWYSLIRATYRTTTYAKEFPNQPYRHTLQEEDSALSLVVSSIEEKKIKRDKLDESLRNLLDLQQAGMLDCWILINGADQGIAQDYPAYRKEHRQQLRDYLSRFVIHGGLTPR